MSSEPLTFEQLWGVPVDTAVEEQSEIRDRMVSDYCPYKKIRCMGWDHGCQVELCIQETKDEGND